MSVRQVSFGDRSQTKNGKGVVNNGLIHLVNSTSLVSAVKEELVEVCNKLGIEVPA